MMAWTDERTADLRTVWGLGWSASEVAQLLGTTRNAVMGKVHRLGLQRGTSTNPQGRAYATPEETIHKIAIVDAMRREGFSNREIEQQLGLGFNCAATFASKHGLTKKLNLSAIGPTLNRDQRRAKIEAGLGYVEAGR